MGIILAKYKPDYAADLAKLKLAPKFIPAIIDAVPKINPDWLPNPDSVYALVTVRLRYVVLGN